jgi:hypothetical protein
MTLGARGRNADCTTVIGLATEQYQKGKGLSLDLSYLYVKDWTADEQRVMEDMQCEFGYFVNPEKNGRRRGRISRNVTQALIRNRRTGQRPPARLFGGVEGCH